MCVSRRPRPVDFYAELKYLVLFCFTGPKEGWTERVLRRSSAGVRHGFLDVRSVPKVHSSPVKDGI